METMSWRWRLLQDRGDDRRDEERWVSSVFIRGVNGRKILWKVDHQSSFSSQGRSRKSVFWGNAKLAWSDYSNSMVV